MSITADITANKQSDQTYLSVYNASGDGQDGPGVGLGTLDVYYLYWKRTGFGYNAEQGQLVFDLSALPVGAKVSAATLEMKGIDFFTNPTSQDVGVSLSTWDGVGTLALGDFDDLSSFTEATNSRFSFPTGSYGVVTQSLTAAAAAAVEAAIGGNIAFTLAVDGAIDNATISGFDDNVVYVTSEDAAYGGSYQPILHVTYTTPSAAAMLGCNF